MLCFRNWSSLEGFLFVGGDVSILKERWSTLCQSVWRNVWETSEVVEVRGRSSVRVSGASPAGTAAPSLGSAVGSGSGFCRAPWPSRRVVAAPCRAERVEGCLPAFAFHVISKTCCRLRSPQLECFSPECWEPPHDRRPPTECEPPTVTTAGMEAVELSGTWERPHEFIPGVILRRRWPLPIYVSSILKPERVWRDF